MSLAAPANTLDLSKRNLYIGASEWAAALGVSKWQDARNVYDSKVNGATVPDNIPMMVGRALETTIGHLYEKKTGYQVRHSTKTVIHPNLPWLGATVDFYVDAGRADIVDAKATSENNASNFGGEFSHEAPTEYMVQAQAQMACTGTSVADFAVLIGNKRLHVARFHRNERFIEDSIAKLERFWHENVLAGVPPAPTLRRWATDLFPSATDGKSLPASDRLRDQHERMLEYQEAVKYHTENLDKLKALVMAEMEDAEQVDGLFKWSNVGGRTDYKTLFEDLVSKGVVTIDLAQQYAGQSSRRFNIVKGKSK